MKCLDCVMICIYLMNCFTLAYPVCCMVVLYVTLLLAMIINVIDGEQMDEGLAVNKAMAIPLLSHLGWTLFSLWVFFRAMAHVLLYALLLYSHLLDYYLVFRWHRGVPSL